MNLERSVSLPSTLSNPLASASRSSAGSASASIFLINAASFSRTASTSEAKELISGRCLDSDRGQRQPQRQPLTGTGFGAVSTDQGAAIDFGHQQRSSFAHRNLTARQLYRLFCRIRQFFPNPPASTGLSQQVGSMFSSVKAFGSQLDIQIPQPLQVAGLIAKNKMLPLPGDLDSGTLNSASVRDI